MSNKPRIRISTADADRLDALLATLPPASPARTALEAELTRADIIDSKSMPADVIMMNSQARFRVLTSGEEHCLRLVYPKDVDSRGGTVSVLAPVGSALLGLAAGDEIDWGLPDGNAVRVRVMEVVHQPARSAAGSAPTDRV